MLRFVVLGSGSKGNAVLVMSRQAKILIDCGFSLKRLRERVSDAGLSLDGLDAVFVTHEHGDHIHGLGVLARAIDVPVYVTQNTFKAFPDRVGNVPCVHHFESGDSMHLKDMEIVSFQTSHDAKDPVSFTVNSAGAKIGFATDLGYVTQLVRTRLAGCHGLVLEANHCPDMLRNGHYPAQLQQRIRSRMGHLSNQDMSSLLSQLLHDDLQTVVLYHLSESNNCPDLVRSMAKRVVRDQPSIQLHIAAQDKVSPVFEVRP